MLLKKHGKSCFDLKFKERHCGLLLPACSIGNSFSYFDEGIKK
mgnify:CR=1 FL=1